MPKLKSISHRADSAFSMIELLVAMAVLSVLIVLMMTMVDATTKVWKDTENKVDAYREARAALLIMSRDLGKATARGNTNFFKLDLQAGAANTNYGNNVFFLTALSSSAQGGTAKSDLCQVGYFLALDRTSASTNRTLNLYRYFRDSSQTYSNLVSSNYFPNIVTGATGEEVLARNIVGMRIRAVGTNAAGQWETNFSSTTNAPLPNIVEISIDAINQDAAKALSTPSDWTDTNSAVISKALQSFTTRINLENKP